MTLTSHHVLYQHYQMATVYLMKKFSDVQPVGFKQDYAVKTDP